jgi:proton-coupled amino acid transporter
MLSSLLIFATLCMLFTMSVVSFFAGSTVISDGVNDDVVWGVKTDTCLIFIGMVAFLFGKIGVIIPIRDIMQNKAQFTTCLTYSLWTICAIFSFFGGIGYLAYGASQKIKNGGGMVTLALDQGNVFVQFTELVFIVSLVPSFALMIYVPVRIWERALYGGWPRSCLRTWLKNLWRMVFVALICYLAVVSGKTFDKVMAIFGSLFGGPLTYFWPAVFHLRLVADTLAQKLRNWFLICFGLVASGFILQITITKLLAHH